MEADCHCSIGIDSENLKGSKGFGTKFVFVSIVKCNTFLINMISTVHEYFVCTYESVIGQFISLAKDCLLISKSRNIDNHVMVECKSS